MYRICVHHGGRKCPIPEDVAGGKPVRHGVTQLKFARSLHSIAGEQSRHHCGALGVPNSSWVDGDSTYKFFEAVLIDPAHKAIRRDPDT